MYLERSVKWQKQQRRNFYNEIILDAGHWRNHVPLTVEAMFQTAGGTPSVALLSHANFRKVNRLSESDYPLLTLDVKNWDAPFR